jgi:hypothetical protein
MYKLKYIKVLQFKLIASLQQFLPTFMHSYEIKFANFYYFLGSYAPEFIYPSVHDGAAAAGGQW